MDIVEEYHKQIDKGKENAVNYEKTRIDEWEKLNECSTSLHDVLIKNIDNVFLEDINKEVFLMFRNAGVKKWDEFVKLRGY